MLERNTYRIVINEDKKPKYEHDRKSNIPSCNEVSVLLPLDKYIKNRDILIPYNDGKLYFINEYNPAYDCL